MKKILRKIKRFFDRVLGDFSDEMYWKYVHFFKKHWKEAYEISDYYQEPPLGNENGLVGYWKFNASTGNILYDSSGNGNHGIIHGATWVERE